MPLFYSKVKQPPLTSLSQESVFKHFQINKRSSIAKKCPETREWHRNLPFHFKKVFIWEKSIQFDNSQVLKFDFDAPLETDKLYEIQKFRKFVDFYLNRAGTRVDYFKFHIGGVEKPTVFPYHNYLINVLIKELDVYLYPGEFRQWGRDLLDTLTNHNFEKVAIFDYGKDPDLSAVVKNIETKAMLYSRHESIPDEYLNLSFEDYVVRQTTISGSFDDGTDFIDTCKRLLANPIRNGSSYSHEFRTAPNFNWNSYTKLLKKELGMETMYWQGMYGLLAKQLKDGRYVTITKYIADVGIHDADCVLLRVEVATNKLTEKVGNGKLYVFYLLGSIFPVYTWYTNKCFWKLGLSPHKRPYLTRHFYESVLFFLSLYFLQLVTSSPILWMVWRIMGPLDTFFMMVLQMFMSIFVAPKLAADKLNKLKKTEKLYTHYSCDIEWMNWI